MLIFAVEGRQWEPLISTIYTRSWLIRGAALLDFRQEGAVELLARVDKVGLFILYRLHHHCGHWHESLACVTGALISHHWTASTEGRANTNAVRDELWLSKNSSWHSRLLCVNVECLEQGLGVERSCRHLHILSL